MPSTSEGEDGDEANLESTVTNNTSDTTTSVISSGRLDYHSAWRGHLTAAVASGRFETILVSGATHGSIVTEPLVLGRLAEVLLQPASPSAFSTSTLERPPASVSAAPADSAEVEFPTLDSVMVAL